MRLDIPLFKGEFPTIADDKLPPEHAALAQDCHYAGGNLQPLYSDTADLDATDDLISGAIQSIYLYEDAFWFSWLTDVDPVKSPIASDPYARVYWTGAADGIPRVTSNLIATGSAPYPAASYQLGVPAPDTAIACTIVDGGDDGDPETDESRAYLCTYVTEYGEESMPGPASDIIVLDDPTVDSVSLDLPSPSVNLANITHKRIYRTNTGGSDTGYYFVAEVPLATATYVDALQASQLGEEISTVDFAPPPIGMKGLCAGTNGILAAYYNNEFLVCEPYLPYAWPLDYRRSLDDDLVAIAATATGFVVGTKGDPYIITGVHPSAMSDRKLEINQSCIGPRSMVDMGEFVIYASPNGLVGVSESRAEVLTRDIIDQRTWKRDFNPSQIRAYRYEDKYVAFTPTISFIYDMRENTITRLGAANIVAAYNDQASDTLYYVGPGDTLYAFDTNTSFLRNYLWVSKEFKTPDITFAAVKVHTRTPGLVGVRVICNGEVVFERDSMPQEAVKIPPATGTRWQMELYGTAEVERLVLAQSMGELN